MLFVCENVLDFKKMFKIFLKDSSRKFVFFLNWHFQLLLQNIFDFV